MASRLVRINPVTVGEVLDGHVSLDLEGIVKLFGNGCGAVDVSGLGGER